LSNFTEYQQKKLVEEAYPKLFNQLTNALISLEQAYKAEQQRIADSALVSADASQSA
jgi:predicted patatin/cPLA2 family phospholipase